MNRQTRARLRALEAEQADIAPPRPVTREEAAEAYHRLMFAPLAPLADFPTDAQAAAHAYVRMVSKPKRRARR